MEAISLLNRSLEFDPGFAAGHAALANESGPLAVEFVVASGNEADYGKYLDLNMLVLSEGALTDRKAMPKAFSRPPASEFQMCCRQTRSP